MVVQFKRGQPPADYILLDAEPGWDSTNKILKVGDGRTAWSELPAINGGSDSGSGSGLTIYNDVSELDAVRTADIGILHVESIGTAFADSLAVSDDFYFGTAGPASLIVTTTVNDYMMDQAPYEGARIASQTIFAPTSAGNFPGDGKFSRLLAFDATTGEVLLPWGTWTKEATLPEPGSFVSSTVLVAENDPGSFSGAATIYRGTKAIDIAIQNTLVRRDNEGHFRVHTPVLSNHPASKNYVDRANWNVSVPNTSTSSGEPGQKAYDENYLYVCIAIDVWKRVPLSTW